MDNTVKSIMDFDRKTVTIGVESLKKQGLNYLTSESCGYSMRLLFDVENEEAKNLLESFLGCELTLRASWNKGIGSIMLTRDAVKSLCIFGALQLYPDYSAIGIKSENFWLPLLYMVPTDDMNDFIHVLRENYQDFTLGRVYWNQESRNVHQFSGRRS